MCWTVLSDPSEIGVLDVSWLELFHRCLLRCVFRFDLIGLFFCCFWRIWTSRVTCFVFWFDLFGFDCVWNTSLYSIAHAVSFFVVFCSDTSVFRVSVCIYSCRLRFVSLLFMCLRFFVLHDACLTTLCFCDSLLFRFIVVFLWCAAMLCFRFVVFTTCRFYESSFLRFVVFTIRRFSISSCFTFLCSYDFLYNEITKTDI